MVHLSIGEISEILANSDSDCETEIGSSSDYSLCVTLMKLNENTL